jgi:GR25 family glycosyltransferase involved in LPS biosynthesis
VESKVITVLEDDAILPHMFQRKIDAARWLVGEMKHDDVKLLYLFCREQIVLNLNKLKANKHEHV